MSLKEEIAKTNFDYDKSCGLHKHREDFNHNEITREYYLTLADKYISIIEKRIDELFDENLWEGKTEWQKGWSDGHNTVLRIIKGEMLK